MALLLSHLIYDIIVVICSIKIETTTTILPYEHLSLCPVSTVHSPPSTVMQCIILHKMYNNNCDVDHHQLQIDNNHS